MTTAKKGPLISLIIPTYKQEKTISKDIQRIQSVMEQLRYPYEMIVIVDGMLDNTYSNAVKNQSKEVKVYVYPRNLGKGFAVRYGMLKASGEIVGFIDAGMDIHPNGLSMLLEHFEWYNADIIVGSKLHPVSKVRYPLSRLILSMGYRFLVRVLFGLSIRDTQVGMKFYKRKVIENVLPRLLVKRYAFDIEILAVAHRLGYKRIFEAPIELDFKESSITSSNFWHIILHMLWDTFAVFYRLNILHYYDGGIKKWKKLNEIESAALLK
ncbi:MAG: glycosyltransferase [Candidatus Levybacteria bacterium]|nr:glycosyltransferase [Candidatus Levybacteria bacterium]